MDPTLERGGLGGITTPRTEREGVSSGSCGSGAAYPRGGALHRGPGELAGEPDPARWFEALGRLSRGVAHEFNNLLLSIDGHAELLALGLGPRDARRRDVQEIQRAVERAAELVSWLAPALSRGERTADVNGVVRGVERLLARTLEEIELVTILEPELGRVHVDAGRLGQTLVHLVLDARAALLGAGRVTIETSALPSEGGAGPRARLELTLGRPDGLAGGPEPPVPQWPAGPGLEAAGELALQLGGTLDVAEGPGGSACRLLLPLVVEGVEGVEAVGAPDLAATDPAATDPAATDPAATDPAATFDAGEPAGGRRALDGEETVLLVEDDDAVRRLACRVLERHGYTVLPAVHGAAALLASESRRPIHLLLADVVLPHISGYELARRLHERHPELRVLLMTGYADRAAEAAIREGHRVLEKPFRQRELLESVRAALDQRPPEAGGG